MKRGKTNAKRKPLAVVVEPVVLPLRCNATNAGSSSEKMDTQMFFMTIIAEATRKVIRAVANAGARQAILIVGRTRRLRDGRRKDNRHERP